MCKHPKAKQNIESDAKEKAALTGSGAPESKNRCAAFPTLVFCAFLFAFALGNLIVPDRKFSEIENRPLTSFPALSQETVLSGAWMSDFEEYASDQLLFRDEWMKFKTRADGTLLRKDNGSVYFGKKGQLFSTDTLNGKQEEKNLAVLAHFIEQTHHGETNPTAIYRAATSQAEPVRISVLLAPTAKSVLPELLPDFAPVSDEHAAMEKEKTALLAADPALRFVDPTEDLYQAAHENGTETNNTEKDGSSTPGSTAIYYKTDHHWTTDGAYIAYRRWAEENGFPPVSADAFTRTVVSESFLGTNDSKAPGAAGKGDSIVRFDLTSPDTAEPEITVWKDITKPDQTETREGFYDNTALETKDQYAYFLGGNDPQVFIRTGRNTGRRLLLIKDSYANCMIPFLALHYDEITVTDLRYSHGKILPANTDQSLQPNSESNSAFTDILFLYNIESFCNDRNLAYLTQLELAGNEQ